ncbi:hypothetical protein [Arenimonas caeni]|jgi:hypothetical protein|uniref:hypothetical protein n=1 Tax=Arenimonas caeni TaxID=2058085 RepID=UPI002A371375|nr:hypothetical protein [Arenimonas caeni]MDY0022377.1 hypothetical protein [Arenimonas caeni]
MNPRTHLHRSLAALPLLALGLVATLHEPPSLPQVLEDVVSTGLACSAGPGQAGPRGLARMPGDLGLLARRLHCSS